MEHLLSMWKASGGQSLMPKPVQTKERFTRDTNYHHILDAHPNCGIEYRDHNEEWVIRKGDKVVERFIYLKSALDYLGLS